MLSNLNIDWDRICVLFRLYGSLKTIERTVGMGFSAQTALNVKF